MFKNKLAGNPNVIHLNSAYCNERAAGGRNEYLVANELYSGIFSSTFFH